MKIIQSVKGFSFTELLIVLAIIGILFSISLPSYNIFFKKTITDISARQLLQAIQLAREEALSRGVKVSLCQSKDQKNCGGEWRDGFIIHIDQDILFSFKNQTTEQINWRAFPKNRTHLQFLPTGMTHAENGTFWSCDKEQVRWAIVVSQAGRARMVLPDKNGKVGADVSCVSL